MSELHKPRHELARPKDHEFSTGILDDLIGFDGKRIQLTRKIGRFTQDHPNGGIVFICGKPGIGKSTTTQQLIDRLIARHYVDEVYFIDQDTIIRKKLADFQGTPVINWTDQQHQEYSDDFEKKIEETRKRIQDQALEEKGGASTPKRRLIVVNINGFAAAGNFGRSTIENLVKKYGSIREVLVAAIGADNRVQQMSGTTRGISQITDPKKLEKYLQRKPYKIYVKWQGKLKGAPDETKGFVLRMRAGLTDPAIYRIRNKQVEHIQSGIPGFDQIVEDYMTAMQDPKRKALSARIAGIGPGELKSIAEEAAYYDIVLANLVNMGLNRHDAVLALNFLSIKPVWWVIGDQDLAEFQNREVNNSQNT